jgi:tripeptidyl-peptidase I
MLGTSVFLTVAVAVNAVFGSPVHSRTAYAVKETHRVPRKWTKMGRAPADRMLNLQIGVKQSQFDELERHLYEGWSTPLLQLAQETTVIDEFQLTEMNY